MNISGIIRDTRNKFLDRKNRIEVERARTKTLELEKERIRQAELAKANAGRARVQQDVGKLQTFNEKYKEESRLKKFGTGLSNYLNKTKAKNAAKESKSIAKRGNRLFGNLGSVNQGSQGLQFGGSGLNYGQNNNSNVFGFGPDKKEPSPKRKEQRAINITIK